MPVNAQAPPQPAKVPVRTQQRLCPPIAARPARKRPVQVHEARCVRHVDPLSLPLWTSVDSPATARPFFFSHAPFVLVLISVPFFLFNCRTAVFAHPAPILPRRETGQVHM